MAWQFYAIRWRDELWFAGLKANGRGMGKPVFTGQKPGHGNPFSGPYAMPTRENAARWCKRIVEMDKRVKLEELTLVPVDVSNAAGPTVITGITLAKGLRP